MARASTHGRATPGSRDGAPGGPRGSTEACSPPLGSWRFGSSQAASFWFNGPRRSNVSASPPPAPPSPLMNPRADQRLSSAPTALPTRSHCDSLRSTLVVRFASYLEDCQSRLINRLRSYFTWQTIWYLETGAEIRNTWFRRLAGSLRRCS